MERRLLLAIALMIGLMVLSNVLFPPIQGPEAVSVDSVVVAEGQPGTEDAPTPTGPLTASLEDTSETIDLAPPADAADVPDESATAPTGEEIEQQVPAPEQPAPEGRILTIRSDLYEYRFDTRGARMVGATLFAYPNFSPARSGDGPVEVIRPNDSLLGYRIATGAEADTVSLRDLVFETGSDDVVVGPDGAVLSFTAPVGTAGVSFEVTYRFFPDSYRIEVEGGLRSVGAQGYTVLIDLGSGLQSNEANPQEDHGQMAAVTRTRTGDISSERLGRLDPAEREYLEGAPFSWVASKSKYFLAALVAPEGGSGFGGVILEGVDEEASSTITATLPVPGGSGGFSMLTYVGPQDFERLQTVGQELHNVNPFGWRWLQWFIRPFGGLVIALLTWAHGAFDMAYGWVLILFGVFTRVVLFPLYQMSMRSQMKQMALQPEIKRIQEKYKEDPPKLQQEMMKAYKEAGVSPLGGCLPMLLPFPILITLFFVFQNTIEFRGVPFLWLPDLSLKDPIYIVPLLMGGSMLLLNWIGQRGMETNQQMKVFTYVLPVVFTFMFAQFAAGLNLYYAASNIASLPQQMYLSKERRAHQAKTGGGGSGGSGASPQKAPPKKKASPKGRPKQSAAGPARARRKKG